MERESQTDRNVDAMKDYSQNGEGAVIVDIFRELNIERGHLVDLGAGDGYTMSNSRNLLELGWTGDLYDGDPKGAKDVVKQWITKESVRALLDCRCKFLNIDLDGNDYWILAEILENTACWPDLIVAEINPIFERNEAKTIPYNGSHHWASDTYYGCSLAALEHLCIPLGYTLIHLHAGINAFLLRNNHAEKRPELIQPIEYRVKRDHKPHDPKLPWITLS